MELFSELGWKGVVGIILASIVFFFAARYEYLKHQVTRDQIVITGQAVELKTKDDTIKVDQVVQTIDNATQVHVQEEVRTTVVKHQVIAQKVDAKEHQINTSFGLLPKTPENVEAQQQILSEARIDGLWEAYCVSQPNDAECPTSPQGDRHA